MIFSISIFSIIIASLLATSLETPLKIFILSLLCFLYLMYLYITKLIQKLFKEIFLIRYVSDLNFITNHLRNESDPNITTNAIDRYKEDEKKEEDQIKLINAVNEFSVDHFIYYCIGFAALIGLSNYMGIIFYDYSYISDLIIYFNSLKFK